MDDRHEDTIRARADGGTRRRARRRLTTTAAASAAVVLLVLLSAHAAPGRLGAPLYWPWLLTGLQVTALWAAGRPLWWGWLLGASMQPPWIAYALVTDQLGFVPGCLVSGTVQALSFWRAECGPSQGGAVRWNVPASVRRRRPKEESCPSFVTPRPS